MTEDEMVGWHHRLNGHEFKQALGVGDGQGGLVCCSPWGQKRQELANEEQQQIMLIVSSSFWKLILKIHLALFML